MISTVWRDSLHKHSSLSGDGPIQLLDMYVHAFVRESDTPAHINLCKKTFPGVYKQGKIIPLNVKWDIEQKYVV